MTIADLAKDAEFTSRFPYVWNKLEQLFLQKQRDFAAEHKGEYELVGRYVEFQQNIIKDLEGLSAMVGLETNKIKRPKLHNSGFK